MNHGYPPQRTMVPQGGPSQRLNELLDNIRTEFETESQRSVEYESQSKYCPATIVAPISGYGEMCAEGFQHQTSAVVLQWCCST